MVDNDIMNELFFPKLTFDNVKSIEKQLHFGARELHYYWINGPHHLEYRLISNNCHFNLIVPFQK